MQPVLDKIFFLKLMRSCSICKGYHKLSNETKYFSSTTISRFCQHHSHQQNNSFQAGFIPHRFLFSHSCLSFSKKHTNLSTFIPNYILRFMPTVCPGFNTAELSFVRWHRSRAKRVMQDDKADEMKEVEGTLNITNSITPEKHLDSNQEQELIKHNDQKEKYSSISRLVKGSQYKISIESRPVDELTLPELSRRSFSLVPYVKRSLTLQKLVMLGVNLDKVQKVKDIPELLIKSDFSKDILPLFKFLARLKVPVQAMGDIFTQNPLLFNESIENLELRVGYLIHKKFRLEDVASMAIRSPVFLLMDPHILDEKLGFLQSIFHLTGNEVRHVALTYPKILPWRQELIADVRFHIKEFIGFNDYELKQIILKEPSIYMNDKAALVKRFDYLHNTMLISHEHILQWPGVLSTRVFIIKNRHLFLLSLDRAQYDPCLENYVSLKALVTGTDDDFCKNVAKCDVNKFYDFCKTL